MLAVPAQQLVRALAREGHGHVLGGQLGEGEEPERREVGQRLVQVPDELLHVVRVARERHLELMVLRPAVLGHAPRVGQLRVRAREAHREGLHRLVHVAGHHRDDQARVQASAQHRAERHVAHQAHPDGVVELLADDLGPLLGAALRRVGVGSGIGPPALQPVAAVLHHQALPGVQLAHLGQRGHRARHVAEREEGGDGLVVQVVAHQAAGDHGLQLRAEDHHVPHHGVVEGLDAHAVADQDAAAVHAVPHRHGEHPAQAMGQVRAVLLVEVRKHLGVAAAAEQVAVRLELSPERLVVVDLAVLGRPHALPLVREGLVAALHVDDREPACPQGAAVGAHEARVVRAAVGDLVRHPAQDLLRERRRHAAVGPEGSGDPAHGYAALRSAPGRTAADRA